MGWGSQIILILLNWPTIGGATGLLSMEVQSRVPCPAVTVFRQLSDARNDLHWRKEVHWIQTDGPLRQGQIFLENARLGRHREFFTKTQLISLNPLEAIYETTDDNPYFLRSIRRVEALGPSLSRITYHVDVEVDLLYHIVGFKLPKKLGRWAYQKRMGRYLRKFKLWMKAQGCAT